MLRLPLYDSSEKAEQETTHLLHDVADIVHFHEALHEPQTQAVLTVTRNAEQMPCLWDSATLFQEHRSEPSASLIVQLDISICRDGLNQTIAHIATCIMASLCLT